VVKFDMVIVRDIDRAKPTKLKMVGSLVAMLLQEGVACLAEGVETEKEAEVCRDLGFDLAQGYLFGRPRPFGTATG
jgi:EAL domain-containing protein (putative c-di-GMP-specific phosphodiesterase class I)